MELIKKDIDEAIENAVKYQDFIDELGYKGYFVKNIIILYLYQHLILIEI